jgi:hypothetical protein
MNSPGHRLVSVPLCTPTPQRTPTPRRCDIGFDVTRRRGHAPCRKRAASTGCSLSPTRMVDGVVSTSNGHRPAKSPRHQRRRSWGHSRTSTAPQDDNKQPWLRSVRVPRSGEGRRQLSLDRPPTSSTARHTLWFGIQQGTSAVGTNDHRATRTHEIKGLRANMATSSGSARSSAESGRAVDRSSQVGCGLPGSPIVRLAPVNQRRRPIATCLGGGPG